MMDLNRDKKRNYEIYCWLCENCHEYEIVEQIVPTLMLSTLYLKLCIYICEFVRIGYVIIIVLLQFVML